MEKTLLDRGLVDNLCLLRINECKNYLLKLDLLLGLRLLILHSALKESYSHGRDLLNAGNGRLLVRQRISLYKQLKKPADYNKLTFLVFVIIMGNGLGYVSVPECVNRLSRWL